MAQTTTTTISNLIQNSYDKLVEMQLRSEPMFRKFADKKPVDVTNPGNTVVFQLHNDLDRVTTTLNEATDVDTIAMKNTNKVEVTVNEWGNALKRTERAALESLSQIDPAIADMLAYNLLDTLDHQVYLKLVGLAVGRTNGSTAANETVVNGIDKTASAVQTIVAADVRKAVAKLRGANVQPKDGAFFTGLLHPDVSYDLRTEAAAAGAGVWRDPHTYTDSGVGSIWAGEIGVFEGVKFIESPRVEQVNSVTRVVTTAVLLNNVATLTSVAHGFEVGEVVTVGAISAVYNGAHTITAKDANTFAYAKTNANVASAGVTGTATTPDHKVIIMGKQALVEATTYEPKTVIGPVIDELNRFRSVGWKYLGGWNIYRPEARYVITCESSI